MQLVFIIGTARIKIAEVIIGNIGKASDKMGLMLYVGKWLYNKWEDYKNQQLTKAKNRLKNWRLTE